jgi:MFS transporter, UMF1 family
MVTWLTHGNHRLAILVTGVFFVGGLALLRRVDLARGMAERQAAIDAHGGTA